MSARAATARANASTPFEVLIRGQNPGRGNDYEDLIVQADLDELEDIQVGVGLQTSEDQVVTDTVLALRLAAEETLRYASIQRDRDLAVRVSMHGDDFDFLNFQVASQPVRCEQQHIGGRSEGSTSSKPLPAVRNSRTVVQRPRPTGHNCVICTDPIHGVEVRAPCGDYYDKECILDLFQAAMRDESLFPPRCCRQTIPLASVLPHMSADLIKLFEEKTKEFSVLKRVYCANASCSKFLGEQIEGAFWHWLQPAYKCSAPDCATRTCTKCKNKVTSVSSHRCDTDQQHREVLSLSTTEGWARCPGCDQMIELNHGCYHMTCRCKTQFCYVCRATWKTCACPQWDERRLIAAAEARADAQLGRPNPPPARPAVAPRPAVVQQPPPRLPDIRPLQIREPAAHALAVHRVGLRPGNPAPTNLANPALPPARERRQGLATAQRISLATAHTIPTKTVIRNAGASASSSSRPIRSILKTSSGLESRPADTSASSSSKPIRSILKTSPGPLTARPPAQTNATAFASSSSGPVASRNSVSLNNVFDGCAPLQIKQPVRASEPNNARETLIRSWMERLRVDHDCDHEKWVYRRGGGRCETCHNNLPLYLFRCMGCEVLVCKRCRINRL